MRMRNSPRPIPRARPLWRPPRARSPRGCKRWLASRRAPRDRRFAKRGRAQLPRTTARPCASHASVPMRAIPVAARRAGNVPARRLHFAARPPSRPHGSVDILDEMPQSIAVNRSQSRRPAKCAKCVDRTSGRAGQAPGPGVFSRPRAARRAEPRGRAAPHARLAPRRRVAGGITRDDQYAAVAACRMKRPCSISSTNAIA